MQTLQQALPSTLKPESSAEPATVPASWVDRVFERLTAQLGTKVADLWAGSNPEAVRREWGEALAGFEPREIARGLEATRARAFAPTLGEFLRLCRPALDPEVAWLEAQDGMRQRDLGQRGEWSHPGVYRAARDMAHEVKTGNYRENRKRWEWLLGRELARGWLFDVPAAPQRLGSSDAPTRGPTPEERAKLAALLAQFRAAGAGREPGVDA